MSPSHYSESEQLRSYTSPVGEAHQQQQQIESETLANTGRNSRQGSRRNSLLQAIQQRRSSQEQPATYGAEEPLGQIDGGYSGAAADLESYKYAKESSENEKTRSARNSPSLQVRRKSSIRFSDALPAATAEQPSTYGQYNPVGYPAEPAAGPDGGSGYERSVYDTKSDPYSADSALQPAYDDYAKADQYEQPGVEYGGSGYDDQYDQSRQFKENVADSQYDVQYGDVASTYDTGADYSSGAQFEQPLYDPVAQPQQFVRRPSTQYTSAQQFSAEPQYQTGHQVDAGGYAAEPAAYQPAQPIAGQRSERTSISPIQPSSSLSSHSESNAGGGNLGPKYKGNGRAEPQSQLLQSKPKPIVSKQPSKKKFA